MSRASKLGETMERLKNRSFDEYAFLCAAPALAMASLVHGFSKGSNASLIISVIFFVPWAGLLLGVRYAHLAIGLIYAAIASYRLHGMLLGGQPWNRRNVAMAFVPIWLGYLSTKWRERGPEAQDHIVE